MKFPSIKTIKQQFIHESISSNRIIKNLALQVISKTKTVQLKTQIVEDQMTK